MINILGICFLSQWSRNFDFLLLYHMHIVHPKWFFFQSPTINSHVALRERKFAFRGFHNALIQNFHPKIQSFMEIIGLFRSTWIASIPYIFLVVLLGVHTRFENIWEKLRRWYDIRFSNSVYYTRNTLELLIIFRLMHNEYSHRVRLFSVHVVSWKLLIPDRHRLYFGTSTLMLVSRLFLSTVVKNSWERAHVYMGDLRQHSW